MIARHLEVLMKLQLALDDHDIVNGESQALTAKSGETSGTSEALSASQILTEVRTSGGLSQDPTAENVASEDPSASRILFEVGTSGGLSQDHATEVTPTLALSARKDTTEVGIPGGLSQALITALDDHDEVNGDCQALKRSNERREALDDHG